MYTMIKQGGGKFHVIVEGMLSATAPDEWSAVEYLTGIGYVECHRGCGWQEVTGSGDVPVMVPDDGVVVGQRMMLLTWVVYACGHTEWGNANTDSVRFE